MERDNYGICLDHKVLAKHKASTFTHVRAYKQAESESEPEDLLVEYAIPQMSGEQLITLMGQEDSYVWRAEYHCDND